MSDAPSDRLAMVTAAGDRAMAILTAVWSTGTVEDTASTMSAAGLAPAVERDLDAFMMALITREIVTKAAAEQLTPLDALAQYARWRMETHR